MRGGFPLNQGDENVSSVYPVNLTALERDAVVTALAWIVEDDGHSPARDSALMKVLEAEETADLS